MALCKSQWCPKYVGEWSFCQTFEEIRLSCRQPPSKWRVKTREAHLWLIRKVNQVIFCMVLNLSPGVHIIRSSPVRKSIKATSTACKNAVVHWMFSRPCPSHVVQTGAVRYVKPTWIKYVIRMFPRILCSRPWSQRWQMTVDKASQKGKPFL